MIPEKECYHFLQEKMDQMVYFGEAPRGTSEPYMILYAITPGKVQGLAGFPELQLSCFGADKFQAIEMGEAVTATLDEYRGPVGAAYTDDMRAERGQPLRNDDGTWMCPVEIRFSYLEV